MDPIYGITPQRGYHESHPFSKWETIRLEAMKHISDMGGQVKYGHAEVGNIIHAGQEMVQHEIEFLPASIEEAADQLVVAKWIIREVAYRHDLTVSFAPKIIVGHAGSGLHIHSRLHKNGEDPMVQDGALSENAKKLISGFIELAPSLTAFGNTVPTSFLRLVPHQEAPTTVCWGDRNRSALVRVPLGWLKAGNMVQQANPQEPSETPEYSGRQTVELRSSDGSANIHHLLAGMAVAALHGLQNPDALKIAERTYVTKDVAERRDLDQLPTSCFDAAQALQQQRAIYEEYGVFPPELIDGLVSDLREYNDHDLSERFFGNANKLEELVEQFIHCG